MSANRPLSNTVLLIASLLLAGFFFMTWVSWGDAGVSGKDFATGHFFEVSETGYGLSNPLPEYAFANAAFWLIPVLSVLAIILVVLKKPMGLIPALAGSFALALATIYYLFTAEELHLPIPGAFNVGYYIIVIAAIALICFAWSRNWIWKLLFIAAPVLITYTGYQQVKSSVMNEKVADTASLPADHQAQALTFIQEFATSDSTANAKYREKVIELTGQASEINATDSTATLSFADSTGSYAIFDFYKEQASAVKNIKVGEVVTVKGICSGGVYSDILGTETISFKHAVLINPKK